MTVVPLHNAETNAPDEARDSMIEDAPNTRKRPKPGERRLQILQTLAQMLEQPGSERVTTAALAAQISVSEAALYRHFASKAQMFEGLIGFTEESVFTLLNQVSEREPNAQVRSQHCAAVLLQFAEKNPGMVRVLTGDALVSEHARLQVRINQLWDRFESVLRQHVKAAAEAAGSATPSVDANVRAGAVTAFCIGRLQRFARSDFKRSPTEHLDESLRLLLA
jgi:TetR/AcrR family transcriptional regulator